MIPPDTVLQPEPAQRPMCELSSYDKLGIWNEVYSACMVNVEGYDAGDLELYHNKTCMVADWAVQALGARYAAWQAGGTYETTGLGDWGVLREFVRDALSVWDDDAQGAAPMQRSMDALRKAARL